jgi:hypothetical protein
MESKSKQVNIKLSNKYNVFNYKELSKTIKEIKDTHFKDETETEIEIFYLKRITKERILINIFINKKNFVIFYELFFTNQELRKQHRNDIPSILLDEIFENFKLIKKCKFHSDNLNKCGEYTLKYISQSKSLTHLELNNIKLEVANLRKNEQISMNLFKKLNNLSLNIMVENFEDDLSYLLNTLITNNSKVVNLVIYYDKEINPDNLKQIKGNLKKVKSSLNEIKINFVNMNVKAKQILTESELDLIPSMLCECFLPDYIEINYFDIMNSTNSKINEDVYLFKHSKLVYPKKIFCLLNSLKFSFKNKLDHKIFESVVKCLDNKIFNIKTNHLQLMLPQGKDLKAFKFIFNLLQDYESIIVRKVKYEDIFKQITTKPKSDNQITAKIKLKENDLNTFSKILARIEGNNIVFLPNGNVISIGGKFNLIYNKQEYKLALNTIIEVDKNCRNLKILTHTDNYFLSHFNASCDIFDKDRIIVVGGMSIAELFPNFNNTPIYLIDTAKYSIERVMPSNKLSPGIVFSANLEVVDSERIKLTGGFLVSDYSGGINILGKETNDSKVVKNEKTFIFDFKKGEWIL